MRRIIISGILALAIIPFGASTASAKPQTVDVCHDGESGWELISVVQASLNAHVKHGDATPGDAVPGMDDYVFDGNCTPVPTSPWSAFCASQSGVLGAEKVVNNSGYNSILIPCDFLVNPQIDQDFVDLTVAACQAEAEFRGLPPAAAQVTFQGGTEPGSVDLVVCDLYEPLS